jgi:hypothetical protein
MFINGGVFGSRPRCANRAELAEMARLLTQTCSLHLGQMETFCAGGLLEIEQAVQKMTRIDCYAAKIRYHQRRF